MTFKALKHFIVNNKSDKNGGESTHYVMSGDIDKCTFYVKGQERDKFYDLYETCLSSIDLGIIEKHRHISPIVIDLDFRQNSPDRQYTIDTIINFIETLFNTIIHQYIEIEDTIPVYILEKPKPKSTKQASVYKDGIHIVIPDIVTQPKHQLAFRKEFIANYPDFFSSFATNKINDIYDEAVIQKNGWLMYGSKKADDPAPYSVTYIMHIDTNSKVIKTDTICDPQCTQIEFVRLLSIRNKYDESKYKGKDPDTVLAPPTPARHDSRSIVSGLTSVSQTHQRSTQPSCPMDIEFACHIVDLLSPERADTYDSWMSVGWCLHNLDSDNATLLAKWIEFSRRSPKFVPGECERIWLNITTKNNGYQLGSLIHWGRQDKPNEMRELEQVYSIIANINTLDDVIEIAPKRLSYKHLKSIFEKDNFKVMTPLTYASTQGTEIILSDATEFRQKYRNLYCDIFSPEKQQYVKARFIDMWFDDSKIRTYRKMDFLPPPQVCTPDVFNTWRGFYIDNLDVESSGNIDPFLHHIGVLVGHHEECKQYFIKWLAQLVQQPGKKNGIATIIISKEGCGKNIFIEHFAKMIGTSYFYETANPGKDLFGRFSTGRLNRLLINIDEAQIRDTFQFQQELKNMITSPTYNYERKNVTPIEMRDFVRLLLTSNYSLVVKLEANSRRYFVVEASGEYIGNTEYFTMFAQYMEDPANQKAIISYLRSIDVSTVNWIKDRPFTNAYHNMQQQCVEPVLKYLENLYIKSFKNNTKTSAEYKCSYAFDDFKIFLKKKLGLQENTIHVWTDSRFGYQVNKYIAECPDCIKKTKRSSMYYMLDRNNMETLLNRYNLLTENSYMFIDTDNDDDDYIDHIDPQ